MFERGTFPSAKGNEMPLSSNDKLRLKLSAKRIEAIKVKALVPWKRKPAIGSTIMAFGQDKPDVSYNDKAVVLSADNKTRSSADKIAAGLKLDGADKYHGLDGEYDHPSKLLCGDGVAYVPKRANVGNASSPFKRVRNNPLVVVIKK